jgi:superfamily II DNA helicase RecQ
LSLNDPAKILISPERKNLRISVNKCQKATILGKLDWLVDLVVEKGSDMPKTIIFCTTMNEMATVCNYLLFKMGSYAYHNTADGSRSCIIGVYHSMTWAATKEALLASFKGHGNDIKKLIIASTALSMGVNFPDVRYIINWGPPRTLIDYHQEAGRAGRDGEPAHSIIIYHGNQTTHCEDDVKQFIRTEGCLRVASLKPFVPDVVPMQPYHDCCSNCSPTCTCSDNCGRSSLPFEKSNVVTDTEEPQQQRDVTEQQRHDLYNALTELEQTFEQHCVLELHGYSNELVKELVDNCSTIFSVGDIMKLPIFSMRTALQILEIFQDIFDDMEEAEMISCSLFPTCNLDAWENFHVTDFGEETNDFLLLGDEEMETLW